MKKIIKARWFHVLLQIALQIINKKYGLDVPPEWLGLPSVLYIGAKTVTDWSENKHNLYQP